MNKPLYPISKQGKVFSMLSLTSLVLLSQLLCQGVIISIFLWIAFALGTSNYLDLSKVFTFLFLFFIIGFCSGMILPAHTGLKEPNVSNSFQLCVQWHHVCNLMSSIIKVHIPQKSANSTNQSLSPTRKSAVKYLPEYHWFLICCVFLIIILLFNFSMPLSISDRVYE